MKLTHEQAKERLEAAAEDGSGMDGAVAVLVLATEEAFDGGYDEGYEDGESSASWSNDDRYDEGYQDGLEEGKSECDC